MSYIKWLLKNLLKTRTIFNLTFVRLLAHGIDNRPKKTDRYNENKYINILLSRWLRRLCWRYMRISRINGRWPGRLLPLKIKYFLVNENRYNKVMWYYQWLGCTCVHQLIYNVFQSGNDEQQEIRIAIG